MREGLLPSSNNQNTAHSPRMTIGRVAKLAGVGVETVRYYEREGIIEQPSRVYGAVREYSSEIVRRILFIKRAQELGFSLADITEMLSLRDGGEGTCARVRDKTEAKLRQIEDKIGDLERLRAGILAVKKSCVGRSDKSPCPILESFYA